MFRNLPLNTPFQFIHYRVTGPVYVRTGKLTYRLADGGPELTLIYGGFAVQEVSR